MALRLCLVKSVNLASAIACVRGVTHESVAVIKDKIVRNIPVIDIDIGGKEWNEDSTKFLALMEALDRNSLQYRLFEDEAEVSRAFVTEVVAESNEERRLQQSMMEVEAGLEEGE